MYGVQIKPAIRDELYEIAVFLDECWKAEYRSIISDNYLDTMSVEERYTGLLNRFDSNDSDFLTMRYGSKIIGAAVFGKSFTEGYLEDGEISAIYLHSDYIGKGYGHTLLSKMEEALAVKGYSHFVLDVLSKNNHAVRFYQKHGYEIVEERSVTLGNKEYPLTVLRKEACPWLSAFLAEDKYIDFSAPSVQALAIELFEGITNKVDMARIAFEFVRDKIPHSFDIGAKVITAKASDVLEHKTGICHAKANLLAALLRSRGIPVGFCFQHITLMDDESKGYCVHCYNAIWLNGRWIKVDARGNKPGVNAQFSLNEPVLAFPCRPQYKEYNWPGIYAEPHAETMTMLEKADSLEYVMKNIPDTIILPPDAKD